MADISIEALVEVLRRVAQIEAGREDLPLAEPATAECRKRGWLDDDLQLTEAGRIVLTVHQGSAYSEE